MTRISGSRSLATAFLACLCCSAAAVLLALLRLSCWPCCGCPVSCPVGLAAAVLLALLWLSCWPCYGCRVCLAAAVLLALLRLSCWPCCGCPVHLDHYVWDQFIEQNLVYRIMGPISYDNWQKFWHVKSVFFLL